MARNNRNDEALSNLANKSLITVFHAEPKKFKGGTKLCLQRDRHIDRQTGSQGDFNVPPKLCLQEYNKDTYLEQVHIQF